MNYIAQINAFWERLDELEGVRPYHIALYFALLKINNECRWKRRFDATFGQVLDVSKMDKDTYYKAADFLNTNGFFEYYQKGKNQYSKAVFELKVLYDLSERTTESVPDATESAGGNIGTHYRQHEERTTESVPNNLKQINYSNLKNDKPKEGTERAAPPVPVHNGNDYSKETSSTDSEKKNPSPVAPTLSPKKGPRPAFVAPDLQEVVSYFDEITQQNGGTHAADFFDHYESNGWKVGGKTKMVSWQAAARNWLRRSAEFSRPRGQPAAGQPTKSHFEQRLEQAEQMMAGRQYDEHGNRIKEPYTGSPYATNRPLTHVEKRIVQNEQMKKSIDNYLVNGYLPD